jgi:hypothetical protein
MKSLLIVTIILAILTVSCKKEDSNPSKKDLLTSGTWKLTAVMNDDDANGIYEFDVFASLPDCFKDNIHTFQNNGKFQVNEGQTKCDPIDPQTVIANWQLTQNETHLTINADEYKLEELSESTLKWKEEYSGGRSSLLTFTKR